MERYRLRNLIRDGKRKCWEDFCTESGEKLPWEVVRWAKDPWRLKERMGRLRGADGAYLASEGEKVYGVVRVLFGKETAQDAMDMGDGRECPYGIEEVMEWVRDALSGTKNNSAGGPGDVGYKLIKAIRDTRLGCECKWGSGLLKSRLCFLTSKKHKQDYKQCGTTTWG